MGGMKRLLEAEMDKKRAQSLKRAGIEETEPPKTNGDKYKSLFDRGRVIQTQQA